MMLNKITQTFDEIAQKRAALQAELDRIEQEEKAVKTRMRADAILEVQAIIDCVDIAPNEVTFTTKPTLVPKFRYPETGETWHGFGKRPAWLKGKNIEDYRITPLPKAEKKSKKSGKKQNQQATTQPVAEQGQAGDASAVTATVNSVTLNADSEAVPPAPITTCPERAAATSDLVHQVYPGAGQTDQRDLRRPLIEGGIQSYLTAVRSS